MCYQEAISANNTSATGVLGGKPQTGVETFPELESVKKKNKNLQAEITHKNWGNDEFFTGLRSYSGVITESSDIPASLGLPSRAQGSLAGCSISENTLVSVSENKGNFPVTYSTRWKLFPTINCHGFRDTHCEADPTTAQFLYFLCVHVCLRQPGSPSSEFSILVPRGSVSNLLCTWALPNNCWNKGPASPPWCKGIANAPMCQPSLSDWLKSSLDVTEPCWHCTAGQCSQHRTAPGAQHRCGRAKESESMASTSTSSAGAA